MERWSEFWFYYLRGKTRLNLNNILNVQDNIWFSKEIMILTPFVPSYLFSSSSGPLITYDLFIVFLFLCFLLLWNPWASLEMVVKFCSLRYSLAKQRTTGYLSCPFPSKSFRTLACGIDRYYFFSSVIHILFLWWKELRKRVQDHISCGLAWMSCLLALYKERGL